MIRFQFIRHCHFKHINRDDFTKILRVPTVNLPIELIEKFSCKKSLLSLPLMKNIRDTQPISSTFKQVLFDPERIQSEEDLLRQCPSIRSYVEQSFDFLPLTITYENYTIDRVMKKILPEHLVKSVNTGSGFSLIGHIAHFNLREAVLPYKYLIAQVVLDKLPQVKTVVNKTHQIDSIHRNFQFEILAGDPNTLVTCRENQATYQFDFARVYWNPRLGTERERIVKVLRSNDLVFDVFAGVGPFVVPASMLGCMIYANDINPESVKWMKINLEINRRRKSSNEFHLYNLDGREFLRTIVLPRIETFQEELQSDDEKRWCLSENKIVILMNLPELAWTFLDVFSLYLSKEKDQWPMPVHIYCYLFIPYSDRPEQIIGERIRTVLPNLRGNQISSRFVRKVSPRKEMFCTKIVLFQDNKNGI